jgi:hypothetical protein
MDNVVGVMCFCGLCFIVICQPGSSVGVAKDVLYGVSE